MRLTPVSEPRLIINPISNAQVLLIWSKEHFDYRLEASSSPSTGEWMAVANNVNDLGDRVSVLVGAGGGSQFFRLSRR